MWCDGWWQWETVSDDNDDEYVDMNGMTRNIWNVFFALKFDVGNYCEFLKNYFRMCNNAIAFKFLIPFFQFNKAIVIF